MCYNTSRRTPWLQSEGFPLFIHPNRVAASFLHHPDCLHGSPFPPLEETGTGVMNRPTALPG